MTNTNHLHVTDRCIAEWSAIGMTETADRVDARPGVLENFTAGLTKGFPNLRVDVRLVLVAPQVAATVTLLRGIHSQTMELGSHGFPPTNRTLGQEVAAVFDVDRDGRFATAKVYVDFAELRSQLGISSAPVRAAQTTVNVSMETAVSEGENDEEQVNLLTARRMTTAFNEHNISSLSAQWAPELVWSQSGADDDWDRAHAISAMDRLFRQFSNLRREVSRDWTAGSYVVQEGTLSGTFDRQLPNGLPKTGRSFQIDWLQINRFENGMLVRCWSFWNGDDLSTQLGIGKVPGYYGQHARWADALCCIFCVSCCRSRDPR